MLCADQEGEKSRVETTHSGRNRLTEIEERKKGYST